MQEFHPELAGYEPGDDRPLHSRRRVWFMRSVVIVTIAALVLPAVVTSYTFIESTAARACAAWVDYAIVGAHTSYVSFEVLGRGVVGWECYSISVDGRQHMISLGMLPGLSAEQAETVGV